MAITTLILLLFFLLSTPAAFSGDTRCHPNDKKALLQIKKSLHTTNNIPAFPSWDPNTDCCEHWYKVECDDHNNRVTVVVVLNADFNRPLPPAVGDLHFLQQLIFHKTNLTGPIPPAIATLSNLQFLMLSWNHLTGPVPLFLSRLKNLNYINLSFNSLTGSIPPELSQLTKLDGLLLDRNRLTGTLPASFADFRSGSFYLYLSHNRLTGSVPPAWGRANFFAYIDLSRNLLEGDISFLFGKNKSLDYADFSRNRLEFDMSGVEFGKRQGMVDLSHNRLYGRLPDGLTELGNLRLNVSYNRLCGRIPAGGNLQAMGYTAYFHNRCLCGAPLPECK